MSLMDWSSSRTQAVFVTSHCEYFSASLRASWARKSECEVTFTLVASCRLFQVPPCDRCGDLRSLA